MKIFLILIMFFWPAMDVEVSVRTIYYSQWYKAIWCSCVDKVVTFIYPVRGHSFLESNRLFGLIQQDVNAFDTILFPKQFMLFSRSMCNQFLFTTVTGQSTSGKRHIGLLKITSRWNPSKRRNELFVVK